jgi:choline-sulfatase/uncharacterized sulfatase
MTHPNVLVIVSDQHNAKCLGHKNHPDVKTPHLDRLASEGVRFDNAITQNPICTPSRVSFLSGQYCHNHGYYGLCGPNPNGLPNVFDAFRRAGYATAAIGKIHCPEYWVEDSVDYFREVCGCSIGGNPEYQAFLRERGGIEAWENSELKSGPYGQCMDGFPSEQPFEQSTEGYIAAETINFMKRAQADGKPFIVHASLPKPHQVYCPAQEFWDMYDPDELTLPPNFKYDMEGKAPNLKRSADGAAKGEWMAFEPKQIEAGFRRKLRGYFGCISHMDHAVGQMLDALDEAGLAEDTIIVYTADHGDYALEHGIIEKAPGISTDAITRVPMIWRVPGNMQSGHVAEQLAELVDIPTTLCHLAGLPDMPTSDGRDLSGLLTGGDQPLRDIAVTEFAWSRAVRKGKYRLVWYPREMFPEEYPEGFGELYDIEEDPWEMKNLYFEPEYQDTVREIQADLMNWLVTTTRPVTVLQVPITDADRADPSKRIRYKCCTEADGKIDWRRIPAIHGTNYV